MIPTAPWQRVGAVPPTALADARETLHHAAQLLALVGASYVPARADDSHTSMTWIEAQHALVTELIDAARPFRAALRPADLTMLVLDVTTTEQAVFPLGGRTRAEAIAWLRSRAGDAGRDPAVLRTRLHFSIAPHPTDAGAPFVRPDASLEELGRWYANAAAMLEARRADIDGASDVRCWPHHFDIATLVSRSAGAVRTIGIGMSPGDASYAEPYFYLGPSPVPRSTMPALEVGHWHTVDWWGAVLEGSIIAALATAADQHALVAQFVDASYDALAPV